MVFWIIWFAIFNGLFILQFFAAGGFPSGSNEGDAPLWSVAAPTGLLVVAMLIRFIVIPKISDITTLLTAMIVGLALSEAVGIIGMFALGREFPQTRMALFVTSVSAVVAFVPVYANALLAKEKMR